MHAQMNPQVQTHAHLHMHAKTQTCIKTHIYIHLHTGTLGGPMHFNDADVGFPWPLHDAGVPFFIQTNLTMTLLRSPSVHSAFDTVKC